MGSEADGCGPVTGRAEWALTRKFINLGLINMRGNVSASKLRCIRYAESGSG